MVDYNKAEEILSDILKSSGFGTSGRQYEMVGGDGNLSSNPDNSTLHASENTSGGVRKPID